MRSTSSSSSAAATPARARDDPSARGLTPPPPPVLHTMGGPTSAIKDGISLSGGGEGAAGSGEVRSDAAKGGVDLALGLSMRTRRQRAQRRSDHTSTTTATSTCKLAAEHRGFCPPANSLTTLSYCSKRVVGDLHSQAISLLADYF